MLYYVMASCDTLGGALKRASRYSRITNEAIELQYRETVNLRCGWPLGVRATLDRHQSSSPSSPWCAYLACSADGSSCPYAYP